MHCCSTMTDNDSGSSKEFVLVRVGADKEQHFISKRSVWDRPYFRDPTCGVMCFEMDDDDLLELVHPGLANIDPVDFAHVAQYLENEVFGVQRTTTQDKTQQAFAEIVSAWHTAENLGMTDLMEHIVDKLGRLGPWGLFEVLAFACDQYKADGSPFPAQDQLKDFLATNLAQHYWVYVQDMTLSDIFIRRLQDSPEMERDILHRRLAALDLRLDEETDVEQEDEGEEEQVNLDYEEDLDMDLYE